MQAEITWLSAAALGAVFGWAALAKILRYSSWRTALKAYGFGPSAKRVAAPAVPLAEAGTAAVLVGVSAKLGAALSLALLAGFSLAVLRARSLAGNRLPCGCFGRAKVRDYRLMLIRNGVLAVLSAVVALSDEKEGLLSGMEAPSAGEALPAALAAVGVTLVAVILYQVTELSRRGRPS